MKCPYCGAQIANDSLTCPNCGREVQMTFDEPEDNWAQPGGSAAVSYTHLTLPTNSRV